MSPSILATQTPKSFVTHWTAHISMILWSDSRHHVYITFDGTGNLWAVDKTGKVGRFGSDGQIGRMYEGLLSAGNNWRLALDQTYIYLSDVNSNKVIKCNQTEYVACNEEDPGVRIYSWSY